jgi:hypothetical protein
VEKDIKEMKDNKATGDDDVSEDIFKILGEDGLSIVRKLIKSYMKLDSGPRIY